LASDVSFDRFAGDKRLDFQCDSRLNERLSSP
jgi:hypothetical protein